MARRTRAVWAALGVGAPAHPAPVEVPGPHRPRHRLERLVGRELLRVVLARADGPVALLAAERRDPALGRDPRAGQREHVPWAERGPDDTRRGRVCMEAMLQFRDGWLAPRRARGRPGRRIGARGRVLAGERRGRGQEWAADAAAEGHAAAGRPRRSRSRSMAPSANTITADLADDHQARLQGRGALGLADPDPDRGGGGGRDDRRGGVAGGRRA